MKKFLLIVAIACGMTSCNNDADPASPGTVNFVFSNKVGSSPLELNSSFYTNGSGETYSVSELKYIISNIVFIAPNGVEFSYPQESSYFVVNAENESSLTVSLPEVEGRKYSQIRFGFGVDQSNYPLNGVNNFIPTAEETGMLWSWSAGYKFIKFEGTFSGEVVKDAPFLIHVGSHGATLDNYKEITLDLGQDISVNDNTSEVNISFNVAQIFDAGLVPFSLEEKSDIQVDPVYAPIIANNVSTGFSTN
ncbi:MAG: MbnP family protein [Gilvibacter sp.]